MANRKLRDIVAGQHLIRVAPADSVRAAAERMQGNHVGSALVLEGDELRGIFTGTDLVRKVLEPRADPHATTVAEVMTPDPFCLDGDDTGIDCIREMRDRGIRHVVVRLGGLGAYGIVSVRDFPDHELGELEHALAFENVLWEKL